MAVEDFAHLLQRVESRQHAVGEVRPVEVADEEFRDSQAELLGDVAAHVLGGGGGVGVDGGVGEELAEPVELPVLGAEVVPPVADAVGLVHGDGVRPGVAQQVATRPVFTSRSGDVNTSRVTPLRMPSAVVALLADREVLSSRAAGTPMRVRPSTWSFISAMSGDTTTVSPPRTTAGAW